MTTSPGDTQRWLGPLGLRLAAAFIAVALAAIGVLTAVVLLVDRNDVSHLAKSQRDTTAEAISMELADAYRARGGWDGADLQPAVALAEDADVGLALYDTSGATVLTAGPQHLFKQPDSTLAERVIASGEPGAAPRIVGRMHLAFPSGGLTLAERHLRSVLIAAVGWSAGLAAAVALIVAVIVARAFIGPIRRLSGAARALGAGVSAARVGPDAGPGELGELGRTFDSMAESLEREDKLRRALIADVAHELRTPVAILQADTEALVDGLSTPTTETLESLHEETLRLARMVEDLQTLASAEAAGLHMDRRLLDLARVASEAADSLGSRFQAAGIQLRPDLPPTMVSGDPYRLRQVVTNLLSNAAKFTPPGGRVTLRVGRDGNDAVVEVTDTGPGVPAEEQPLIWDRFYRGSAGRMAAGTGIGLAVVKELASAHGGSVTLDSPPGGGARFTVRIPSADSRDRPSAG
jgi:two-component system sensor histidine kinase BaeS